MSYCITVDFGAGAQNVTPYLISQYPVNRARFLHNGLKPVIGTCKFAISRNTALINQFLAASTALIDPVVTITKDESAYFKGKIRRTKKITIGQLRVEAMECQCVDMLYRLEKKKITTSFTWANYKICDPATKSASLLHQLLYLAGYSDSELNLSAINMTVDRYTVDGTTTPVLLRSLIEEILRDIVYTLRPTATGVLELYDLYPGSYPASLSLSTGNGGNIAGGYDLDENEFTEEAVDVTYWTHELKNDVVVFEDTTGATSSLPCSIILTPGKYYPDGADANIPVRCDFKLSDYDLVAVDSPVLDWAGSGDIVKQIESFSGPGLMVRFYSATGGVITKLRVRGNATVKKIQNKVSYEIVASTNDRESITSNIIVFQADAERVAKGRAAWKKFSSWKYIFPTVVATVDTVALLPGSIVGLLDNQLLGASQTLRIIEIDDGDDKKTLKIICEAVGDFASVPLISAKQPSIIITSTEKVQPLSKGILAHRSYDDADVSGAVVIDNSGAGHHGTKSGGSVVMGVRGKGLAIDDATTVFVDYGLVDMSKGWTTLKTFAIVSTNPTHDAIPSIVHVLLYLSDGTSRDFAILGILVNVWYPCGVVHNGATAEIWVDNKIVDTVTCGPEDITNVIMTVNPDPSIAASVSTVIDEEVDAARAFTAAEVLGYSTIGIEKKFNWADYLNAIAADGVITPQEKSALQTWWAGINGDGSTTGSYWTTRIAATMALVSTVNLESAYANLLSYLFTAPGILAVSTWNIPITINASMWESLRIAYAKVELDAQQATTQTNSVAVANGNVPNLVPQYWGPYLYPNTPSGAKINDTILWFCILSGDAYRGVFKFSGSSWIRSTDAADIAKALRDIIGIVKIKDTSGNYIYGTESEYGITASMSVVHLMAAFIDYLEGGSANFSGTLKAGAGEFAGALTAREISTEQAQSPVPGGVCPPATHWIGSEFVTFCTALAAGWHSSTGILSLKTVTNIIKGDGTNSICYESNDTEISNPYSYFVPDVYKQVQYIISLVTGKGNIFFDGRDALLYDDFNVDYRYRILKNGAVLGYGLIHTMSYRTESVLAIDITKNDIISIELAYIAYRPMVDVFIKNFRISPLSGAIGIKYSTGEIVDLNANSYYSESGNIKVDVLTDFITAGHASYWLGEDLRNSLAAIGASLWFLNILEPNGWSETYGAVISNYMLGKICTSYKLSPSGVIIYNEDLTETNIYLSQYYGYSANNHLYPQSRSGSVKIVNHKIWEDSNPNIIRMQNMKNQTGDQHYTVFALNAPRVDSDPTARFESTLARVIEYWDGVFHAFVLDDSMHGLVEDTIGGSESIAIDTIGKTITRTVFDWWSDHVGPGEMIKLRGFTGSLTVNNGYYNIIEVAGKILYYDITSVAVPIDCSGITDITIHYPIKVIYPILNQGGTNDVHHPSIYRGYQKNSGEFEYASRLSLATKRIKYFGGRAPTGKLHGNYTQGVVFTTLDAVLLYRGEWILIHGTFAVLNMPITIIDCAEKISATTIRFFGITATGVLAQFDCVSGGSETFGISISW